MNIKHRIYARKIVLSYLYQYCFFVNLLKQDKVLTESLFIDYIFKTDNKLYEDAKIKLMSQIQESIHVYTPEEFQEFIACFFDERTMQEIDFDYVLSVGSSFPKYQEEIQKQVDTYAQTFKYDVMDPIDQAIFLLGYTEWKELGTPKEVLLNEMIEMAKRYSDAGSPKLINGILHKVFNAE